MIVVAYRITSTSSRIIEHRERTQSSRFLKLKGRSPAAPDLPMRPRMADQIGITRPSSQFHDSTAETKATLKYAALGCKIEVTSCGE
jgi:hypothetical protein